MDLRRLLASMRRRRDRSKTDESTHPARKDIAPSKDDVPPANAQRDGTRVSLILEGGDSVPLEEDERLEYLTKNLLSTQEGGHD